MSVDGKGKDEHEQIYGVRRACRLGGAGPVTNYIRSELARRFGSFKFVVYDTSDPSLTNGRKLTVVGQLELELGV